MSGLMKSLATGCGFTGPRVWIRLATWLFAAILWAVGVALLSVPISAHADDGAAVWTVSEVSGQARARADVGEPWLDLKRNDVLGPSAEVQTGPDGKAVLVHRGSKMQVSPNSRLALPSTESAASGAYRILQQLGDVLYRVKDRVPAMKRFEVETPYLAAVVKGTTFNVDASSDGGMVKVVEGIVGVNNMNGLGSVTITAGQSARIGAAPGSELKVSRGSDGKAPEKSQAPADKAKGKRTEAAPASNKSKSAVVIRPASENGEAVAARHPSAVPIFGADSGTGLFAKGVTIETAFAETTKTPSAGDGDAYGVESAAMSGVTQTANMEIAGGEGDGSNSGTNVSVSVATIGSNSISVGGDSGSGLDGFGGSSAGAGIGDANSGGDGGASGGTPPGSGLGGSGSAGGSLGGGPGGAPGGGGALGGGGPGSAPGGGDAGALGGGSSGGNGGGPNSGYAGGDALGGGSGNMAALGAGNGNGNGNK